MPRYWVSVCWASFLFIVMLGVFMLSVEAPYFKSYCCKFWKVYWLKVKFANFDCRSVETTKTQQSLLSFCCFNRTAITIITYIAKYRCKLWFRCLLCRSFLLLLNYSSKKCLSYGQLGSLFLIKLYLLPTQRLV